MLLFDVERWEVGDEVEGRRLRRPRCLSQSNKKGWNQNKRNKKEVYLKEHSRLDHFTESTGPTWLNEELRTWMFGLPTLVARVFGLDRRREITCCRRFTPEKNFNNFPRQGGLELETLARALKVSLS